MATVDAQFWLLSFVSFFLFWLHCAVCRILVPRPGIELGATVVRAPSPNHWTPGGLKLPSLILSLSKMRHWLTRVCACTLSCIRLFVTQWTVACQAPLSMQRGGRHNTSNEAWWDLLRPRLDEDVKHLVHSEN